MEALTESYFYILLCLRESNNHGYGIMQRTIELSNGRVKIGSGTMYGAVSNMLKRKWIVECESADTRKRMYQLTTLGKEILESECDRLEELVKNICIIRGE